MLRDLVTVLSDGSRIAYVDAGVPDGSTVMLLHGTPACRLEATGTIDAAARELDIRLVAPDRPGSGGSSFVSYRVVDYPVLLARFADAIGLDDFAVVGTSGGGRYACATGCLLGDRVRHLVLAASTISPDFPGARSTWNKSDRTAYLLARRTPWLFRALVGSIARKVRRDPDGWRGLLPDLSAADEHTLESEDASDLMRRMLAETLRLGARGVAHDYRLEASPWGLDLAAIKAPVDIWHGQEDTVVGPDAGRRDPRCASAPRRREGAFLLDHRRGRSVPAGDRRRRPVMSCAAQRRSGPQMRRIPVTFGSYRQAGRGPDSAFKEVRDVCTRVRRVLP